MASKLLQHVRKRWFLAVLLAVASGGYAFPAVGRAVGNNLPGGTASAILVTLFLMSFTLRTDAIFAGFTKLKGITIALAVTYLVLPVLFYLCAVLCYSESRDIATGLFILAAVPCTLASSPIWTRIAGGNDALALVITMISNGLNFLIAPFILKLLAETTVAIDPLAMMWKLFVVVFLPITAGQIFRLKLREFADRYKPAIGVGSQVIILCIILIAVSKAGSGSAGLSVGLIAGVALAVSVLHLLAVGLIVLSGKIFKLDARDRVAVVFGGSQKTLPLSLHINTEFFGGAPLAVLPIMLYHACQLVIDSVASEMFKARIEGEDSRPNE